MRIEARAVTVAGPHFPLLEATSLQVGEGELAIVAGAPDSGQTAFGLTLAGRLKPASGEVLIDGRADPRALRTAVALVDSPEVTAPEGAVPLAATIAEELALAGQRAGKRQVRAFLEAFDATSYAHRRWETVPASVRLRMLIELAASRPGVRMLVLDSPDRHAADPALWWLLVLERAEQGFAVVVLCGTATEQLVNAPVARLGSTENIHLIAEEQS